MNRTTRLAILRYLLSRWRVPCASHGVAEQWPGQQLSTALTEDLVPECWRDLGVAEGLEGPFRRAADLSVCAFVLVNEPAVSPLGAPR